MHSAGDIGWLVPLKYHFKRKNPEAKAPGSWFMVFVSLVNEDVYTTVQVLLSNVAHFNLTDLRVNHVFIDVVIVD